MRSTHTIATMEVSVPTYMELKKHLNDAGYSHALLENGVLDMTHVGVYPNPMALQSVEVDPGAIQRLSERAEAYEKMEAKYGPLHGADTHYARDLRAVLKALDR